jgi:hypothetical protein
MTLHNVGVAAEDGAGNAIPGGIRQHDSSGTGAGPNVPENLIVDSTGNEVLGTTADTAQPNPEATASLISLIKGLFSGIALASLPLPPGASTATGVAAVVSALGSPMQESGGSVAIAPSTTDVAVTPAVTASAYTAGNVLGGIMTFTSLLAVTSFNGILQSITAKFKGSVVTGSLEIAVFKASPSNGTYTDKSAPTWNAADMANLLGIYTLSNPNSKLGAMTTYNLDGIGKAIAGTSQSLFAVVIVDGTPTPASTSDFTLELAVLPG